MNTDYLIAQRAYHEASKELRLVVAIDEDEEGRAEKIQKAERKLIDQQDRFLDAMKDASLEAEKPIPGELKEKTSFARFMAIAGGQENWDGAERELQQELFASADTSVYQLPGISLKHYVPIEAFGFGQTQLRADAITNPDNRVATQSRPIAQQVFDNPVIQFIGAEVLTVPAGETRFSWITAGATAGLVNRGAARDVAAVTIANAMALPARLSTGLVWNYESVSRVGSDFESKLKENVRLAIDSGLEDTVLNAAQTADNTSGTPAVTGIFSRMSTATSSTANDDTATSWAEYMALPHKWVSDNEFPAEGGKRMLIGDSAYKHMKATVNTSLATYLPAYDGMQQHGGIQFKTSDRIPDPTDSSSSAGEFEKALFIGKGDNIKVPIWRNAIVLPSVDGAKAQGRLDIHTFMNIVYTESAAGAIYGVREINITTTDKD